MMAKSLDKESIRNNFLRVSENIEKAAAKTGRTANDIILLAATKTVDPEYINYAVNLGIKDIGENRVQELLSKIDKINTKACRTHFIGHLQTNKVRNIIGKVDLIQSVDSLKLAKKIDSISAKNSICTNVLIEVNIGGEPNKFGVSVDKLHDTIFEISKLKNIKICGLMTVLPICNDSCRIKEYFMQMHEIFIDIKEKTIDNVNMDYLSMGMSSDYIEAIECGANIVRIGSAIFDSRV